MKATFLNTVAELRSAAERAGLFLISARNAKPGYQDTCSGLRDESIDMVVVEETTIQTTIYGSSHAVMRLIGAIADDGQDTLLRCIYES